MTVPPDFGGFLAYWLGDRAVLSRYGHGKAIEGVTMTPLNLLQARKMLDELIEQGEVSGRITDEHRRQSGQLPPTEGLDSIMPRERVDEIAGPE